MGHLHQIYATRSDMEPGLHRIEEAMALEYVLTGIFEDDRVIRYSSAFGLPSLGLANTGERGFEPRYLVIRAGDHVRSEGIPQLRGGIKYFVDQRRNRTGNIVFQPGGLYRNEVLISGEMGTPFTDKLSMEIFQLFYQELFREFVKIQDYHVGPEAFILLKQGFRLTPGMKWSRQVDLPIPDWR